MKFLFLLLLPTTLLLSACDAPDSQCAALPQGKYCLQPSTSDTALSIQQKVAAEFGSHREIMIADIEADATGMQFVALTPFGQKVLHVAYDNKIASAQMLPDAHLDAAQLLALLQIALWPADMVKQGLRDLTLLDAPTGRQIMADGKIVIDVRHDASPRPYQHLRIAMPTLDASLDMETLTATPEAAQ